MRGWKVIRSSCGVASHLNYAYSRLFSKHPRTVISRIPFTPRQNFSSSSASKMGSQEQWPAARVRETFLDYFKKNGHTFG